METKEQKRIKEKRIEEVFKNGVEVLINNYSTYRMLSFSKKERNEYKDFLIRIYERLDEVGLLYSHFKDISFNEAIKELDIKDYLTEIEKKIKELK